MFISPGSCYEFNTILDQADIQMASSSKRGQYVELLSEVRRNTANIYYLLIHQHVLLLNILAHNIHTHARTKFIVVYV